MARVETIAVQVRAESGATAPASLELLHRGAGERVLRGVLLLGAGAGGGIALVVVPVLHLVTTWLLPLAGLVACVQTLRTPVARRPATLTCPACGESFRLERGPWRPPQVEDCPACRRPLTLLPAA